MGRREQLKLGDGEVSERTVAYGLEYRGHQAQAVRHIVQGIEVQSQDFASSGSGQTWRALASQFRAAAWL